MSVTAPVPEAKVPAPCMCKSLPIAMATSALSVTAPVPGAKVPAPHICESMLEAKVPAPVPEAKVPARVPDAKVPAPVLCTPLPTAMATSKLRATAPVPGAKACTSV